MLPVFLNSPQVYSKLLQLLQYLPFLSLQLEWLLLPSVNAACRRWKKSSWVAPLLDSCSPVTSVLVPPVWDKDLRMAVNVVISDLSRHPWPLHKPSIMETRCFCNQKMNSTNLGNWATEGMCIATITSQAQRSWPYNTHNSPKMLYRNLGIMSESLLIV